MISRGEAKPFLNDVAQHLPARRHSMSGRWINHSNPNGSRLTWLILSHFAVFVATSLLWGVLTVSARSSSLKVLVPIDEDDSLSVSTNFTRNSRLLRCGHSTPEAKRMGCGYDILSNHWIPAPCLDQEAIEEYQADGSWFGFADETRTERISIDTMSEMEYYYTSERDHIVHCAMLWRKQFRAFYEERSYLDTIIGSFDHTMHCSQFLIDMSDRGPDYRNMPIKTFVGHAGCWVRDS